MSPENGSSEYDKLNDDRVTIVDLPKTPKDRESLLIKLYERVFGNNNPPEIHTTQTSDTLTKRLTSRRHMLKEILKMIPAGAGLVWGLNREATAQSLQRTVDNKNSDLRAQKREYDRQNHERILTIRNDNFDDGIGILYSAFYKTFYADIINDLRVEENNNDIKNALTGNEEPRVDTMKRVIMKAREVIEKKYPQLNDEQKSNLARMIGFIGAQTQVTYELNRGIYESLNNAWGLVRNIESTGKDLIRSPDTVREFFLNELQRFETDNL